MQQQQPRQRVLQARKYLACLFWTLVTLGTIKSRGSPREFEIEQKHLMSRKYAGRMSGRSCRALEAYAIPAMVELVA